MRIASHHGNLKLDRPFPPVRWSHYPGRHQYLALNHRALGSHDLGHDPRASHVPERQTTAQLFQALANHVRDSGQEFRFLGQKPGPGLTESLNRLPS